MSNIVRDGFTVKKLIVGILAAGSTGVAIYYGYSRWKSRRTDIKEDPKVSEKKSTDLSLHGPEKADPTPVLSPTPAPNTKPLESLNISTTFEKVSLPNGAPSGDSPNHSSTDSFEKVPTPPEAGRLENRDAPLVTANQTTSGVRETVSPAGGRKSTQAASSDTTGRSRSEMKVEMPGAVKAEPAKTGISSVTIPQSPVTATSEADDDGDDEDEDDDDEEDATDSDASGDSQKKER